MGFPTPQQQAVITSTARDILVEAGAGSGKTTTMVERYIDLVRNRGFEPREILAFTFTDKAAGELREKVRKARQELARDQGQANPASISMSDAWVGTFHAICNRILKAWPVEAGIDPRFGVIDDVTAATVRNNSFQEALAEFRDEADDPTARESMIGLITEQTLRGTITSAFDELRSRGISEPVLPEFESTQYPESEIVKLAGIAPGLLQVKGATGSQKEKIEAIIELLSQRDEILCEDIAPLAFESTREGFREFCDLMPVLLGKLAAHEFGDEFRRDLGRLLELFGQRFRRHKERRSVLDYEDLQLTTVQLLRNHPRIRDAYRERFREIMVDEFQDTNRLQLDLVELLRGEETTLVTVGDEMQSIYGFRHAEVELFRARRGAPGIAVYRLTDNFRSQPQVIAAVNLVGGELDRQVTSIRGTDAGRHKFAELTIGLEPDLDSSVEIVMTEREGWKPLDLGNLAPAISEEAEVGKDVDHFNEAEALHLAHRLKGLVESGQVRQKDIAILLRAKTRAALYVAALRQVGLDPYLSGGSGFWGTREATDIRALLSVIANPLDDESLLTVLASPVCGLSADALWTLGRSGSWEDRLWKNLNLAVDPSEETAVSLADDDRQRGRELVETIDELRTRSRTVSLATLVDQAVERSGYDLACLAADPSGNGLAAVRRVSALAREFESAEGRDLRGFLDWAALSADLDSESAVATSEEESDVVKILTVHAAKGLEFGVVCVPDCGRASVNRHNYPLLLGRPGSGHPGARPEEDFALGMRLKLIGGLSVELYDWPELKRQAGSRLEDEELRLFHVALTRAKERLIVSGVPPRKFPNNRKGVPAESRPMILRICETFDLDPEKSEEWPPGIGEEPGETIIDLIRNQADPETAKLLAGRSDQHLAGAGGGPVFPPLTRPDFEVFPNVPLSFTSLTEFTECPSRFYARRVLGMSDRFAKVSPRPAEDPVHASLTERDRATSFGIAVHEILESLGRSRWPRTTGSRIEEALARNDLDSPADLERAGEMIEAFIDSDLGRRIAAGEASFEVPLLLSIEGITIRGFVDLLLEGEPPLMVDYKTNRLEGKSPEEKMGTYGFQRDLYGLAIARAGNHEEVNTAFVFLERADHPVEALLGPADLARAEEEIRASLREIVEGRFFGGSSAARQPCRDCWACRELSAQLDQAA